MDCERFHHHLDAWLEGNVDGALAAEVRQHLGGCGECRAVELALRAQAESGRPEPGAGFVHGVMAQTTGHACGRAGDRLGSWLDGELDVQEARLVAAHVAECDHCGALARTMRELQPVLRSMASVEPDPNFTADVLLATLPAPSLWSIFRRRAADLVHALALRPALPQEAAFVATLLLVLLTATPFAPWPQLPARALGLVHELAAESEPVQGTSAGPVARAWLSARRSVPLATLTRESEELREGVGRGLQRRLRRTGGDLDRLGGHLLGAGRGVVLLDFETIPPLMVQIGCDLERLWGGLRAPDSDPNASCG